MNKNSWSEKEKKEALKKILSLDDIQIVELFEKVGLYSPNLRWEDVIANIRSEGIYSDDFEALIEWADSKKHLLESLNFFLKKRAEKIKKKN